MIIHLNGSATDIAEQTTIEALLEEFKLDRATVIIELNSVLLDETASLTAPLKEGDVIEFVRFVGGG